MCGYVVGVFGVVFVVCVVFGCECCEIVFDIVLY